MEGYGSVQLILPTDTDPDTRDIRILRIRNTDFRADLIWMERSLEEENQFCYGQRQNYNTLYSREWRMDKCGPAYSAAANLPALPHPLGYFWPGKLVPTRFSALLNALQQKTNYEPSTILQCCGSWDFLIPGSVIRDG
jgi:hypothetical protein